MSVTLKKQRYNTQWIEVDDVKRQLTEVATWLNTEAQHAENILVEGVAIDSRVIKRGDLFIPFRGEQVNGHKYVRGAIENGAVASLWLKDEPNPPTDLPLIFVEDAEHALQQMARAYRSELQCEVIGVTGSNGKTSTKDLIASVLAPYFKVQKTEGNYNNELGLPLTILSIEETTQYAVLEMGMSGFGEISFLSRLAQPEIVIITNIGEAHLQDLGSRKGIAQAKFEIIDGLQQGGTLIYDGDETLLRELVEQNTHIQSVSFGLEDKNDIWIKTVDATSSGSEFSTKGLLTNTFTIPVYGSHQAKNALAALLIGNKAKLSLNQMVRALQQAELTPMRMQPVLGMNGELYINDAYNAAPTSLRAALHFLQTSTLRNEKWVVLGDMLELGEQERAYHESFAEDLLTMDLTGIILFGPRMKWLYEKVKNSKSVARLHWIEEEHAAIRVILQAEANEHSVILLKGSRGMMLEKVLNGDTQ